MTTEMLTKTDRKPGSKYKKPSKPNRPKRRALRVLAQREQNRLGKIADAEGPTKPPY